MLVEIDRPLDTAWMRLVVDQLAVPVEAAKAVDGQTIKLVRGQGADLLRPFLLGAALRRHEPGILAADLRVLIRTLCAHLAPLPNGTNALYRRLVSLDPGCPDHGPPAADLGLDLGPELVRRAAGRLHQLGRKLVADAFRFNCFYHLTANSRNDGFRGSRRRKQAIPGVGFDIDAAFLSTSMPLSLSVGMSGK